MALSSKSLTRIEAADAAYNAVMLRLARLQFHREGGNGWPTRKRSGVIAIKDRLLVRLANDSFTLAYLLWCDIPNEEGKTSGGFKLLRNWNVVAEAAPVIKPRKTKTTPAVKKAGEPKPDAKRTLQAH